MTAVTEVGPLPGNNPPFEIPISPASVPARFPSPAQDYYDGGLDLNKHLIADERPPFIVRVNGGSMTGAGISDGELTVKRLVPDSRGDTLHPENPDYPDVQVPDPAELNVWGVATRCLHYV